MAGKKKKSEQSGDGKKGFELPKTIAGVKIPKDIRGSLVDLAKHPIVADLLAAGLVALAARVKDKPVVRKGAAKAGDAAHDLADAAGAAVAAIVRPVVERTRKLAADTPATSTTSPAKRPRKSEDALVADAPKRSSRPRASTPAAQPAKRTKKATDATAAKPRATRRTAPKKSPKPPQNDA